MTCVMCAETLRQQLGKLAPIESVAIDLNSGLATIRGDLTHISANEIGRTVASAGYQVATKKIEIAIASDVSSINLPQHVAIVSLAAKTENSLELIYLNKAIRIEQLLQWLEENGIAVKAIDNNDEAKTAPEMSKGLRVYAGISVTLASLCCFIFDIRIPGSLQPFIPWFAAPFFVWLSRPIFTAAFRSLRNRVLNMDVMYALGMGVAFTTALLSSAGILPEQMENYETGIMLATFLLASRRLESIARERAYAAIERLQSRESKFAWRVKKDSLPVVSFTPGKGEQLNQVLRTKLIETFPAWARNMVPARANRTNARLQLGGTEIQIDDANIGKDKVEEINASYWQQANCEEIANFRLESGDWLRINSGEKIPADGTILFGSGTVDEALLSGESRAIFKQTGDKVYAGTVCFDGHFYFAAEEIGEDTRIRAIQALAQQALASKPKQQQLADRLVRYFIPLVLLIAFSTLSYWLIQGVGLAIAVNYFVSVLVIACPCALGLALPTAIAAGLGRGAQLGILYRGGNVFEQIRQISTVFFDKTGTLSEGKATIAEINGDIIGEAELLALAASLEEHSQHPIARRIVTEAKNRQLDIWPCSEVKNVPGAGVEAKLFTRQLRIGKVEWVVSEALPDKITQGISALRERGASVVGLSRNGQWLGSIALTDQLRGDVLPLLKQLKKMGLKVGLISGDHRTSLKIISEQSGIDLVYSEATPEEKLSILSEAGTGIAFVGDGINDAPALARADVGMAVIGGSDMAKQVADVVLMRDDMSLVATALRLGQKIYRQMRLNLFWAILYNILLIPLAAGVLEPYGLQMQPHWAGLAMSLSSLSVVIFSLMLFRYKP
jgi:heavy metal translocating P-type ATPase